MRTRAHLQAPRPLLEEPDLEAELDGLHERVGRLRAVVGSIEEETRAQSGLVAELEAAMHRAQGALRETAKRAQRMYKLGRGGCVMGCLAVAAAPELSA